MSKIFDPLKRIFFLSFITLLIVPLVTAKSLNEYATSTTTASNSLPQTCRTDCITPYGQTLGITAGNVVAYSNCRAQCVKPEPYYQQGTYTGIKWQCVEFARRWLLVHKGVVYGDVNVAADIWNQIHFVTRVADGKKIQLKSYLNGSTQPPQVGDLLIYAKAFFETGHVAVVTHIDSKRGLLQIAEQNFSNQSWNHKDYARQVKWIEKTGRHWVLDAYLLGWKRLKDVEAKNDLS